MVKYYKDDLADIKVGTIQSSLALVKIISAARTATKEDFLKIFNAHTMQKIKVNQKNYSK